MLKSGMSPLAGGRGMRPPFSLFATKKTGRARSKRKTLGRKAGAAGAFFACIRGSQQETALQNLSRSVGRGPSLAESFSRQPASGNCEAGIQNRLDLLLFPLPLPFPIPGGVVQNRGPAGPLVWSFQGGPGETGEAPPAADEASLFRGSGAIGGPEKGPGIAMPRRC